MTDIYKIGCVSILLISILSGCCYGVSCPIQVSGSNYVAIEDMPVFPGGDVALTKFVFENLNYPAVSYKKGTAGSTSVRFLVTKTGEIKDVKALRYADSTLARELVRVVKSMPRWTPGKQNGEEIDMYFTLPININQKSS